MTDITEIPVFKIKVCSDNKIRAQIFGSGESSVPACSILVDSLRGKTIQALTMMLREDRLDKLEELKILGSNLAAVLFYNTDGTYNDVGRALDSALSKARTSGASIRDYMRVELEFEDGQQSLASWPWEYLYCSEKLGNDDGYFLAYITKLVLTRRLTLSRNPCPLLIEDLPMRVLFVAASPKDLSPVEYDRVLEDLRDLARANDKILELRTLIEAQTTGDLNQLPTAERFQKMVENYQPHVVHFVGHGRFNDSKGQLAFMRTNRAADWIADDDLAMWLIDKNIPCLRLVFLQACESALSDPDGPYRAISGVANHLACRNIPAVVGMQFEIKNEIANRFARTFYKALLEAKPVEIAVQESRTEIRQAFDKWAKSRAFGLPVLYLRGTGGLLKPARPSVPERSGSKSVTESIICYKCGAECEPELNYCERCSAILRCPECRQKRFTREVSFCGECGTAFKRDRDEFKPQLAQQDIGRIMANSPTPRSADAANRPYEPHRTDDVFAN